MQLPPPLRPAAIIGVAATARSVTPAVVQPFLQAAFSNGYRTRLGAHLFAEHGALAGTDAVRAADFNELLQDETVKAIWLARGGYGSTRMVDQVDWQLLAKHPKWLVGYSDATVLLAAASRVGVAGLHAPLAISFGPSYTQAASLQACFKLLQGQQVSYPPLTGARQGSATGRLIGGNLSLLAHQVGSPWEYDYNGAILLLEEVDEYHYHLDRMLNQLKHAGRLAQLAGLVVGDFLQLKDNVVPFGLTYREIITQAVAPYHYPVAFDLPVGHGERNLPLVVGAQHRLTVNAQGGNLTLLS